MTNPTGKSNLEKYNDAKDQLARYEEQLSKLVNKTTKTYIALVEEKIPKTKQLISELEPIKEKRELSETAKTFLREWIISRKYKRSKEFTSRQTDKGHLTEQDGFQLIQDVYYPGVFLDKCDEYLEDDFKTGNPDVLIQKVEVIDNKSSYDLFTFPFGILEIPSKDYEYQINSYMDLTGVNVGKVYFTLNETPFTIVQKELKRWAWDNEIEFDDIPERAAYEIIKNHVFTRDGLKKYGFVLGTFDTSDFVEIPKEKRIVMFEFVKNDELLADMHDRVLLCREWVNENWDRY